MSRRFQFSLRDILLATGIVAAAAATIATGEVRISFISFAVLLIFVWQRPVLFRLWLITAMGVGAGLLTAMHYQAAGQIGYLADFKMSVDEIAGWGAGMLVGGLAAWQALLRNPPHQGQP